MEILGKVRAEAVADVVARLSRRRDGADHRIRVLRVYLEKLRAAKSAKALDVQRSLGVALMESGRGAEAAPYLRDVHREYLAAKNPAAAQVWLEWVRSLLLADDPAGIEAIASETSDQTAANATADLMTHLAGLKDKKEWSPLILLSEQAMERLDKRLTEAEKDRLRGFLSHAQAGQAQADRQRVAKLVGQLIGNDEPAREAARAELQTMGKRAVVPMVEQLKQLLETGSPAPKAEELLLATLRQIAPRLSGYDPSAPKEQRIKRLETWLENL
jgi:hypothetical protein